jgi:hypothetical protein
VNEERLRKLLRDAELPDEAGARERGWRVVRAAYEGRAAAPPPAHTRGRLALALALAGAAILAIVLTPAGAKVADVFRNVAGIGNENAKPALSSLPAPGRLLVGSAQGAWVVNPDGSKRLLGDYRGATWSPHGLFVAMTRNHQLAAVEPGTGTVRWTLASQHRLSDPAWSPSGYRIAYRAGHELRVVAGDGSPDRGVARETAAVTPTWRPLSRLGRLTREKGATPAEELAYADHAGRVRVLGLAEGRPVPRARLVWESAPRSAPHTLLWTPDRRRLVAVGRHAVRVFGGTGTLERTLSLPPGMVAGAAALGPDSRTLAVATSRMTTTGVPHGAIKVFDLAGRSKSRQVFSGPGRFASLAFSPNGRWLLLGWRDANQWVFVPLAGGHPKAVSHISQQFAPGASGPGAFPRLDGWCCSG